MLTSQQIDAAIKAGMARHKSAGEEPSCELCCETWPCQYMIQATISLKLSAIAVMLGGSVQIQNQPESDMEMFKKH